MSVESSRDAADWAHFEVCVSSECVRAPIGDTKKGWCPFCAECLREMLIPLRPTETTRTEVRDA